MNKIATTSPFLDIFSKHNIAKSLVYNTVHSYPAAFLNRLSPDFRIQTGITLLGGMGSLPLIVSCPTRCGRGGAYCIIIPAAKSSARDSMISLSNCISFLRRFDMRSSRASLNSASLPWWQLNKYSTSLRSRSSAVAGFRITSPFEAHSAEWVGINYKVHFTYHNPHIAINRVQTGEFDGL